MKQGINLSLGRKSVDKVLQKAFVATVAIFCFTVLISFSLIIYRLILKSSYDALDAKEQKLNSQLLTLQDKKDKFVETKARLEDIKKIISKRLPMNSRISDLTQVIPSDASINSISGTDVDIKVSMESDNLTSLNDLMEQKIAQLASDKKKGIKTIQMRSFGINPKTHLYNISFGITFN